jgi:hypothetical protein
MARHITPHVIPGRLSTRRDSRCVSRVAQTLAIACALAACGQTEQGDTADAALMDTGALPDARGVDAVVDARFRDGHPPAADAHPKDADAREDSSPPPPICTPSNCPTGCCGSTGCVPGLTPIACGFGAQSCDDCNALGLACVPPLTGEQGGVCGVLDAGASPDGAPACGPATCGGCCASGVCVSGTATAECGSHGQACVSCDAALDSCEVQGAGGACVGSGATCSPSNCTGCCDSNGFCQDATAIQACGSNGLACAYCLPGEACNSGQCQAASSCGPFTCNACCQGDTCVDVVNADACGSAGAACTVCDGVPCIVIGPKIGGYCYNDPPPPPTPGECGLGNCTGCCDLYHVCHPGNTNNYCAGYEDPRGEVFCGTCAGTCASGTCDVPRCGPENCEGCCTEDGTCWKGEFDGEHCGAAGSLCVDCGPGYDCIVGSSATLICAVPCTSDNCQGCCGSGICYAGTEVDGCGAGGNDCQLCAGEAGDMVCMNGACVTVSQCGVTLCAGCCQDDVCLVGDVESACGTGGMSCTQCSAGQTCLSDGCAP